MAAVAKLQPFVRPELTVGSGRLPVVGLSCRCLYGAVRQQCAGHLPFERQARANGGFSILPTGSTDPERYYTVSALPRLLTEQSCHSWRLLTGKTSAIAGNPPTG